MGKHLRLLSNQVLDQSRSSEDGPWAERGLSYEERMLAREEAPELPAPQTLEAVSPWLHRLPAVEQDMLRLYYQEGLRQVQIARIFGMTQAAVSHRLSRARVRLQWLQTVPLLDPEQFDEDLSLLLRPLAIEIMRIVYETTCQEEAVRRLAARDLPTTQGAVRLSLIRSLRTLRRAVASESESFPGRRSRLQPYVDFFGALSERKFGILWAPKFEKFAYVTSARVIAMEEVPIPSRGPKGGG